MDGQEALTNCTCELVWEPEAEFDGDEQFRPYQPTPAEVTLLAPLAEQYARARRAMGYTVTLREAQNVAAMQLNHWELSDKLTGRR